MTMKIYEISYENDEEIGGAKVYVPTKRDANYLDRYFRFHMKENDIKVEVLEIPKTAKGFCEFMENLLIVPTGL